VGVRWWSCRRLGGAAALTAYVVAPEGADTSRAGFAEVRRAGGPADADDGRRVTSGRRSRWGPPRAGTSRSIFAGRTCGPLLVDEDGAPLDHFDVVDISGRLATAWPSPRR